MNFNKRVAFYTLGCKVNQYETESIKNQLIQKGYTETAFEDEADIYIVNSCTVTSVADRKTRNMLRRAKKVNPNSKVIVTGCYAQTNSKELLEMEDIDYVIGNKYKKGIVNFVDDIENRTMERLKNDNIFDEYEYTEYEFATLREMSRAYVKIQDGCNNFCSYCKIPFARGRSRSRKKESILKEIKRLVSEGFKEVILIGINLGAYGEDLEDEIGFEDLLEEVLQIENLERVRIGSVYPDKISDRFIEMFKYKKLMPHLHISLQSCDDTILKMMKRNYGSNLIDERLSKLKNNVEGMEYTADIIVGFPGETQEMFQNSYDLINKIGFSGLHIFQYSDREKTIASKLENKVDPKIKKERADKLEELKKEMSTKERKKYIGHSLKVLIEEEIDGYLYGYSDNYLRVKVKGEKEKINEIVEVKIASLEKELLLADE
ncbi:(Dimethylallyl)adenosine tRNA methylthiotransferase MiaB [Fusobacterium necrogenes]|uniref:Threonylcarbamoyladenosine tRNA methylthiotransferase MtaB n=1 Tax=Fusobacterium necrogenes TaxID=858 RepID=A0A377GVA6_9FUSO|nr:tRNA (N(6)-L-threonylcarbamoyladenosine(37)-C(2))-methylthiotransferase MtaB [Fusobacterium necrogenes]STO30876.1 (Dimethylallyl)adenosine tRNA methylthiotransferase MiaB [Fusobacterium necrogenes]